MRSCWIGFSLVALFAGPGAALAGSYPVRPVRLIAGESHWTIVPAAAVATHIKAGHLRALVVSTRKRSPLLPDLPTVDEAGVPGYEYNAWS